MIRVVGAVPGRPAEQHRTEDQSECTKVSASSRGGVQWSLGLGDPLVPPHGRERAVGGIEICEHYDAFLSEQKVLRAQAAVEQVDAVECVQCHAHLGKVVERQADRQSLSERILQRSAGQEFAADERGPVVPSDLVDRHHVALVQVGDPSIVIQVSFDEAVRHFGDGNDLQEFLASCVLVYTPAGGDARPVAHVPQDAPVWDAEFRFRRCRLSAPDDDRAVGLVRLRVAGEARENCVRDDRIANLGHHRQFTRSRGAVVEARHLDDRDGAMVGIRQRGPATELEARAGEKRGRFGYGDAPAETLRSSVEAVGDIHRAACDARGKVAPQREARDDDLAGIDAAADRDLRDEDIRKCCLRPLLRAAGGEYRGHRGFKCPRCVRPVGVRAVLEECKQAGRVGTNDPAALPRNGVARVGHESMEHRFERTSAERARERDQIAKRHEQDTRLARLHEHPGRR